MLDILHLRLDRCVDYAKGNVVKHMCVSYVMYTVLIMS